MMWPERTMKIWHVLAESFIKLKPINLKIWMINGKMKIITDDVSQQCVSSQYHYSSNFWRHQSYKCQIMVLKKKKKTESSPFVCVCVCYLQWWNAFLEHWDFFLTFNYLMANCKITWRRLVYVVAESVAC